MIKGDFEFVIASAPDREKVFCEIYYKSDLIAEISQETKELIVAIYSHPSNKWWEVPLIPLQNAIEEAKKHLMGG